MPNYLNSGVCVVVFEFKMNFLHDYYHYYHIMIIMIVAHDHREHNTTPMPRLDSNVQPQSKLEVKIEEIRLLIQFGRLGSYERIEFSDVWKWAATTCFCS